MGICALRKMDMSLLPETSVSAHDLPQLPSAPLGVDVYDPKGPEESHGTRGGWQGMLNRFADGVRHITPAAIVNSGGQINFGIRAVADGFSVWSALREGSKSPPRLIASLITLTSEVLGTFFKDEPITEEESDRYRKQSWQEYFVTKTKQSMDPVRHIGEASGMALILNGFFTAVSGIRQSSPGMRSWEIWQGAFTTVAGIFMTYMPVRERAWQLSSLTFLARTPFAWLQARRAYGAGYPDMGVRAGDWQQGAKFFFNHLSTAFGFFYGGVHKNPDGTIVRIAKGEKGAPATVNQGNLPPAADKQGLAPSTKVEALSAQHEANEAIAEARSV